MLTPLRKAQRKAIGLLAPALFSHYFSKAPRMRWPQGKRFALTISFDYDFPQDVEAIPELLELLASYEVPASHACIGRFIEKHPRLHRRILEQKDEIINHTYSHPNNETFNPGQYFNRMEEAQQEAEIAGFEKVAQEHLDYRAVGFRTPHFGNLHTPSVYEILERRGYLYSSSTNLTQTQSYGIPYPPSRRDFRKRGSPHYPLLEMPMMACPEHYKPLFDSWHCFRSVPPAHAEEGGFLGLFQKSMELGEKYGGYLNFYFDPRDVVRLRDFERALGLLAQKDAWVAKTDDVARWASDGR